jgi:hypothetical protein
MEFTCEQIGITQEELQERVVAGLVEKILGSKADDDEDRHVRMTVMDEAQQVIVEAINAKVDAIAAAHILPRVEAMIEGLVLQQTNQWGEKTGKPVTFIEYLIERAETYMTATVDFEGKAKGEASYGSGWKGKTSRIAFMIDRHLQYSIENALETVLRDANDVIKGGIEEAVKIKLKEISIALAPKKR